MEHRWTYNLWRSLSQVPYFTPTPAHGMAVIWNILAERKGYSSNQAEFWIVITFKAAEPVAVRVLVVGEHACRTATRLFKNLSFVGSCTKPHLPSPCTLGSAPGGAHIPVLVLGPLFPPLAEPAGRHLGRSTKSRAQAHQPCWVLVQHVLQGLQLWVFGIVPKQSGSSLYSSICTAININYLTKNFLTAA